MYRQSFLKEAENKATCSLSNPLLPENLEVKEFLRQRRGNKHEFFHLLRSHQISNNIN
jgi:hypothetical protein